MTYRHRGLDNEAGGASGVRARSEGNGARGLGLQGFAEAVEGFGNG